MRRRRGSLGAAAGWTTTVVMAGLLTTPLRGQEAGTKTPAPHRQVLSASPVLLVFKWLNVDYERKVSPAATLGMSASYLPIDEFSYTRLSFHARFYPQRDALSGFYVGVQTGAHRARNSKDHAVFLGVGADVGYAWLFGPNRNVSVSVGFGATRLFGNELEGASVVLPGVRLVDVGIAF